MKNKKIISICVILIIIIIGILVYFNQNSNTEETKEDKEINIETTTLIADSKDFEKVYKEIYINNNQSYIENYQKIEQRADEILNEALCIYEIDEGNRLLFVSRQCKDVVENLSFMVKILEIRKNNVSGDEQAKIQEQINKYVNRVVEELINVCNFEDWHPEHFLDTAEMSYSVALGYNWLNEYLSEENKKIIETAILEKALLTSVSSKYDRQFSGVENNWNQVCNGALIVSAMSIYNAKNINVNTADITDYSIKKELQEKETIELKELCKIIIERGIKELPYALKQIEPDGGYAEGITYWEYGNSYMIYALSSMQLTLNNTFGLLDNEYMKQTILYPIYLTGKSSNDLHEVKVFNYGDADDFIVNVATSTWLANKYYNDKELSYIVNWYQENYQNQLNIYQLLWQEEEYMTDKISEEELNILLEEISDKKYFNSEVAVLQNNILDKDGMYVAIKAGKAGNNSHYDLDIGSFVLDAMGTRWIEDFGKEDYNVTGYWGRYSRRNYYKKRAEAHSTIVFEEEAIEANADQYLYADCKITDFQSNEQESHAVLDLSNAYNANDNTENYDENPDNKNDNKIQRKITLDKANNKVILEDDIVLEKAKNIYSMFNVTKETNISIDTSGKIATLTQLVKQEDGTEKEKTLIAEIKTEGIYWQTTKKAPLSDILLDSNYETDYKVNIENADENKLCIYLQDFKEGKIVVEFYEG